MKLELTKESADALRKLANQLLFSLHDIDSEVNQLLVTFFGISDQVGVHAEAFQLMINEATKAVQYTRTAFEPLSLQIINVADAIDEYVALDYSATQEVCLRTRPLVQAESDSLQKSLADDQENLNFDAFGYDNGTVSSGKNGEGATVGKHNFEKDWDYSFKDFPCINALADKKYFKMVIDSYKKAGNIACRNELEGYSDHREKHVEMVMKKSIEAATVISLTTGRLCGSRELMVAAFFHDTGMDGGKEFADKLDKGNDIRKAHSRNSAMHVLNNRDLLEQDGIDADYVAALVMLHSKSCSGVRDLSLKTRNQRECAKIDKVFSIKEALEDLKKRASEQDLNFNFNNVDCVRLADEAAALRIGDSFGHVGSSIDTQSSGHFEVQYPKDQRPIPTEWRENIWKDEIRNATVIIRYSNGKSKLVVLCIKENLADGTAIYKNEAGETIDLSQFFPDEEGYTKMYPLGEGNISEMHSELGIQGEFVAVLDVADGERAHLCTQQCLIERFGELNTAKRLFPPNKQPIVTIRVHGKCSDNTKKLYESFRSAQQKKFGLRVLINFD